MKQSHFNWDEVSDEIQKDGIEINGRVQLRLSRPAPVYIAKEGYEILLGYAATFDEKVEGKAVIRIDDEEGLRAFAYMPVIHVNSHGGESFTNVDRQVQESGAVQEVRRALMMQQRLHQANMREMRHERHLIAAAAQKVQNGPKTEVPGNENDPGDDQKPPEKVQTGPKTGAPGQEDDQENDQGDQ